MSPEPRCVFDTNALISALLFEQSPAGKAFLAALEHGLVLASQATLLELNDVLSREKFDAYLAREDRERFILMLVHHATLVDVVEEVRACRDPKDGKFLEVAVNGRASHLVTGDKDLLALHRFRGISIVTPAQFLSALAIDR